MNFTQLLQSFPDKITDNKKKERANDNRISRLHLFIEITCDIHKRHEGFTSISNHSSKRGDL